MMTLLFLALFRCTSSTERSDINVKESQQIQEMFEIGRFSFFLKLD